MHRLLGLLLTAAISLIASTAGATDPWPNKPIKLIVPFPAGGAADIQARMVAARLNSRLGQVVVVDNKSGAGGNIGSAYVAQAEPDGYTFLMGTPGPMAINQHLYSNMSYNPMTSFEPVSFVSSIANVLVVNPKTGIESVDEFLTKTRTAAEPMSVGIPGKGSAAHLAVVSLEQATGIKLNHIFYKGSAPAIQDLIGGFVPIMISELPSITPHLTSGKLRAIAVTTESVWPLTPDLPPLSKFVPGFVSTGWFVIVAPRQTPKSIVEKMRNAVDQVLAEPEVIAQFHKLGAEPVGGSPEKQIRSESEKWGRIIVESKLTVE